MIDEADLDGDNEISFDGALTEHFPHARLPIDFPFLFSRVQEGRRGS